MDYCDLKPIHQSALRLGATSCHLAFRDCRFWCANVQKNSVNTRTGLKKCALISLKKNNAVVTAKCSNFDNLYIQKLLQNMLDAASIIDVWNQNIPPKTHNIPKPPIQTECLTSAFWESQDTQRYLWMQNEIDTLHKQNKHINAAFSQNASTTREIFFDGDSLIESQYSTIDTRQKLIFNDNSKKFTIKLPPHIINAGDSALIPKQTLDAAKLLEKMRDSHQAPPLTHKQNGILFGPWTVAIVLHELMHLSQKNLEFPSGLSLNFDQCFGEMPASPNNVHCRNVYLMTTKDENTSQRKFLKSLPRAILFVEMPSKWIIQDNILHLHVEIAQLLDDAAFIKSYRPLTLRLPLQDFASRLVTPGEAFRTRLALACSPDAWGNPWAQLSVPALFADLPWELSNLL